jgi:hypothetical protein
MKTNEIIGLKCVTAWISFSILCLLFGTGCAATRTSPKTVKLASVQARVSNPVVPLKVESPVAVGIRYPSGFQSTEAKLLFAAKVDEMMTMVDKKGRRNPDPDKSWQFFPEEMPYKSLAASLQLRNTLQTNYQIQVFLIPCEVGETNGSLTWLPKLSVPPVAATVDVGILNVLLMATQADIPWYKSQGCNMSLFFAPMVAVSIPTKEEAKIVAGTRRWLTPDGRLAIVLPEVTERRFTGYTYGLFMNYPIVKPGQTGFLPLNMSRPASTLGYYELDSFVEREKTDKDFAPYWRFTADIISEEINSAATDPDELARAYARSLGITELPDAKLPLAKKLIEAEWKYLVQVDDAKVAELEKANWFSALEAMNQSEDKALKKAKSQHFWNQFAQVGMAFVGAAAAGGGAAIAANSGTAYNSMPVQMATMNAVSALQQAGGKEQLNIIASYKTIVGQNEISVTATSLGLDEMASGKTIRKLDDIRHLAHELLD